MTRERILGIVFVIAVIIGAVSQLPQFTSSEEASEEKGLKCEVPVSRLNVAQQNFCLTPSISSLYLQFENPVNFEEFTYRIARIPGIDRENFFADRKNRFFRILYYWSRIDSEEKFIINVIEAIDDPKVFAKTDK